MSACTRRVGSSNSTAVHGRPVRVVEKQEFTLPQISHREFAGPDERPKPLSRRASRAPPVPALINNPGPLRHANIRG